MFKKILSWLLPKDGRELADLVLDFGWHGQYVETRSERVHQSEFETDNVKYTYGAIIYGGGQPPICAVKVYTKTAKDWHQVFMCQQVGKRGWIKPLVFEHGTWIEELKKAHKERFPNG